jgi:hypothetical protein
MIRLKLVPPPISKIGTELAPELQFASLTPQPEPRTKLRPTNDWLFIEIRRERSETETRSLSIGWTNSGEGAEILLAQSHPRFFTLGRPEIARQAAD